MFIFADVVSQESVQSGATVLSCGMALASAVLNYLSNRDRLVFDAEKRELKQELKYLKEERAKQQADLKALQKDRDALSLRLDVERRDREQQGKDFTRQLIELRDKN